MKVSIGAGGKGNSEQQSEPALFFLFSFLFFFSVLPVMVLAWEDSGWSWIIYCTLRVLKGGKSRRSHLSTSEYALGRWLSVKLLRLWPLLRSARAGVAGAGSLRPETPACLGTLLGAVLTFFLGGAGVAAGRLAAPPAEADALFELCLAPRVRLAAIEAVNVSSSWEADPKRTCSSVSAASEKRDRAPARRLQESQHSLL